MVIAALVQAHHRPDLLGHLIDRLSGDLWQVYVHLDKKSNAADFVHLGSKVRSFESIYRVNWASFSHVLATLHLMRRALKDSSNTHFYLMSGQCYPIKRDEQIAALLEAEAGNFISVIKMPVSHKPLERLTRWHFHDAKAVGIDSTMMRGIVQKIFNHLRQRDITRTLRGMQPYGGSLWWMLNRETACAVITFLDDNPWYLNAFRWSFAADEMFFQTILANLNIHPDRMAPTFAKWIEGEPHPLPVNGVILSEARSSWHLMARKFTDVISDLD
jgi:core-2/I-Branching enzyme